MLPAARALIAELDKESLATRRMLERVPDDRLDWRPHPKSMSIAQLANHVATIPGGVARMSQLDAVDVSARSPEPAPGESRDAILATLDASLATARDVLSRLDEASARAPWRLSFGDREIFTVPRLEMLRTMLFNHWIHHRGELVVYLRLLDIPVPVVYGRSADENPFAPPAAATA
jgi:uncharacterized damage-inducible protein DinB